MDAVDKAKKGDVNFFKEAPLDLILNARNEDDDNVLSVVVLENHLDCCQAICERCPSLVYHRNSEYGYFALGHAAYRARLEMMTLIIKAGIKADLEYNQAISTQGVNNEVLPRKALTLQSHDGQTAMHYSQNNNKIESVKLLIEAEPNKELLRIANDVGDTPLHYAVGRRANLEIAKMLIEADPDLEYSANKQGLTPLLIAIKRAELYGRPDMLKLILELQPSQCKVRVDTNGGTALHYAVSKGYLTSVGDIIQSCPEISKVADNEGQNFFHRAVKSGNVKMVKHILGMEEITEEVLNSKDMMGRTPWDVAAESQNESMILCLLVDYPKFNLTEDDLRDNLNFVDENGETILFKAAQDNNSFLYKELYEIYPALIYHQRKDRQTVLHHAALRGELEMLKVLIEAGDRLTYDAALKAHLELLFKVFNEAGSGSYIEYAEDDSESEKNLQKKLLAMVDDQGDTALHKAVQNHKLKAVRLLLQVDLDYEYNENNSGDTPIMIAIREARSNENKFDSAKIRRLFFEMQPKQTMAHRGEKGWTSLLQQPTSEEDLSIIEDIIEFCTGYLDVKDSNGKYFLHFAVELGKIEVVRLVLSAKYIAKLTSCLKQLDNEGKNFLHIAAEFEKVDIVKQVLRVKDIPKGVLDKQDKDGNTPFHIAALTGNEPLTRCFLFHPTVNKDTVNKEKQHVLSAIKFPYDKRKARVHHIAHTVDQSELKDQSDFDLVVGALIATVSFTAGITVPGGYISDGPNQGTAVFSKRVSFASFTISNTFALVFSLLAVFSHFCARRLSWDADIICLLNVAKFCTLAAMYCMMAAFIAGSFAILAKSNWLAMVVCIISCLFFIFGCGPLWMWMIGMQSKRPASQHIPIWFKKCFGLTNVGNASVEEGGNASDEEDGNALDEEGGNALVSPKP